VSTTTSTPVVTPTGAALGADIGGVDLTHDLDGIAFDAIAAAWIEHGVLRFRGQHLTDEQLIAFSRRFGRLDAARLDDYSPFVAQLPEIMVISNVVVDGKPLGKLGAYEAEWHTDISYVEEPPKGSVLYALELPPAGGNTGFASMFRAYDTLPPALAAAIEGRRCVHDAAHNSAGVLRAGFEETDDPRKTPGPLHPLVRTHPDSGRKALFLGRRKNAYIEGLPIEESERILDALWAHATQPAFTWHQEWRIGDLIMWDNRSVMHRRDAFDPNSRRIMHRTQIKGDRPF
jgi:taurine dioxygenase